MRTTPVKNHLAHKICVMYGLHGERKPSIRYRDLADSIRLINVADIDAARLRRRRCKCKFAAALQRAQRGEAPILARIETNSGHGAGKGRTKLIAELADMLAFAARHSGLDVLGRDKASGGSA